MRKLVSTVAIVLALAPAAVLAESKIGSIDFTRALNEVDEGKATATLLKKEKEEKQKQFDAKKVEFEKAQADFEKQAMVMNEQARKDKAQDLDRRARELQALFMNLQKDLSEREREATGGMIDRMRQIVGELAEADGLTLVIEKSALVYSAASLDITNEAIRKYNARYPLGSQKAASGKKPDAPKKADAGKKADKK